MEFRRYDKINCSLFDLIDGDLEPKQTMALGYLLAKSQTALKRFLNLTNIKPGKYDKYIVDCEAQKRQTNNNKRIDVLIRFYKNSVPQIAIIIEAKSVRAGTNPAKAATQVASYNSGFQQLTNFKNIELVVLTKESSVLHSKIHSITWTELISELHKSNKNDELISDFINYIINIKGGMNYYEEEILAIPAGKTITAVKTSGIYECPGDYKPHKRSLYISFKAQNGGDMSELYKLKNIYVLDINDNSAITAVNNSSPGFATSINTYKKQVSGVSGVKQIYVIDISNPIKLPNDVRPLENNTAPAYYTLSEFFSDVNSNIGRVIVQKNIWIDDNNNLHIQNSGQKTYDVYENHNKLGTFLTSGVVQLNTSYFYEIDVKGTNKGVSLKKIEIKFVNSKWQFYYIF